MRVAVLIISWPHDMRYLFEKSVWHYYMNEHEGVDCFFLEANNDLAHGEVLESKNHLQIGCKDNLKDGIFKKTIYALRHLKGKYDFYIRTNLSTYWRFDLLRNYLSQVKHDYFYGGWRWGDFIGGFSIILNQKSCDFLIENAKVNEHTQIERADDVTIGVIMRRVVPKPYKLNSQSFYWEYEDKRIEESIQKIRSDNLFIVRTLPHWGMSWQKLIFQALLREFECVEICLPPKAK